MLAEYFPILLFILVGLVVGVVPVVLGSLLGPHRPDPEKTLALRMRLRGLRGRAHEVRRALLPGGDPVHPVRPRDRVPVSLGRGLNEIGLAGFLSMMLFLGILVVGFVYEWMKGALEWE